jgi:hypothetical protein
MLHRLVCRGGGVLRAVMCHGTEWLHCVPYLYLGATGGKPDGSILRTMVSLIRCVAYQYRGASDTRYQVLPGTRDLSIFGYHTKPGAALLCAARGAAALLCAVALLCRGAVCCTTVPRVPVL